MKRWLLIGAVGALVLMASTSAATTTDTSKYREHIKLGKIVRHRLVP
jgi:hypothetical protein